MIERISDLIVLESLCELLPRLTGQQLADLQASVAEVGVLDPIAVWDVADGHTVIDGHNRLDAARAAGLTEVDTRVVLAGGTLADAIEWALRANLTRRHLTPQQMSELRGRLYESEKKAEGRPANPKGGKLAQNGPVSELVETAEKVARETGVSKNTVKRDAAYVRDLDKLRDDLREQARQGDLSKADVAVLARYDHDAQADVLEIAERNELTVSQAADQYERAADTTDGWPTDDAEYEDAAPPEPAPPTPQERIKLRQAEIAAVVLDCVRAWKAVEDLAAAGEQPELAESITRLTADHKALMAAVRGTRPVAVCPKCNGTGECGEHPCKRSGLLNHYMKVQLGA